MAGGETIASMEIEKVVVEHEAVSAVAVVAQPDETWGESPCAFVELMADDAITEDDLAAYCREKLAGVRRVLKERTAELSGLVKRLQQAARIEPTSGEPLFVELGR